MIYNQWYVILESKEIGNKKPIQVKRLNETLVIWRNVDGSLNCIADRCCHRGASLSGGKIIENKVECPFHGFQFASDGKVKLIPANGINASIPASQHVKAYSAYENYGFIWIWWGDETKKTEKPYFFEELTKMSYATFIDKWDTHYSRCIENQLDVVHLPFVHKTSIGRGNKTLVHGPVVEREGDLLTFYVYNVLDDGQTRPLKPNEIENYKQLFHLKFHYPNIWQNCISDNLRIFAAFVPVDDNHTLIYLRNYQSFVRIPILKNVVNYLMKLSNIGILRQDKRVVIKQLPKRTDVGMNEQLIMGDKPIIEYRKYRKELIDMQ